MSDASTTPGTAQQFTLNAPPPVRALAIGAGAVVVGAVLLVLWGSLELPVVLAWLAGLLLVLGLALTVAALVLTARLRTEVRLDETAITVSGRGQERSVTWPEVTKVSLAHPRLSLQTGGSSTGLVLVNPRGPDDPVFGALVERVRQRLDGDRGYRDLPGPSSDPA